MGDFKQGILPHWDYMWKDKSGKRLVGMVLHTEKHVQVKKTIAQLQKAYERELELILSVKYKHTFRKIEGKIVHFDEDAPVFTLQGMDDHIHHIFIEHVLRIEYRS
ncbi:hypothetical protein BAMA_13275 [Bacillus manliponensis]|uniref:YolD-like protein n=1 Tax=Bacillus manliponensis TaxID=574376 RepID=A0A073K1M7_9BACI|nr:hypothetical protein [Bacillus manliponensis]KEK20390.1 hypothetical protein BAMA_13275 [Bacillus manliponensis]